MSRKVSANEPNYRPNNPRRRKFGGNQFTAVENVVNAESIEEASTSAKKIKSSVADVVVNLSFCYRIIEFVSVFSAIADMVVCKSCKQKLSFGESGDRGLGFKISVKCMCGITLINSGPFIHNSFEINRRIVFAMRLLGVAREGINIFCGIMDLGRGISKKSYEGIVRHISESTKKIFDYTCKKAIKEEKKLNEQNERPLLNITVSGDGSWKKRGFSSLYGVTTLIAYHTGKVIDLVVKSSYCQACIYYDNKDKNDPDYLEHKENCSINHTGSAGQMEVDAVLEMFQRSEELFGVKYSNYIGDGDAKTFKAILDVQPFGEDFKVTKSECIGHVEKRLWTTVWRLAPKHLNCGVKIIEIAAFLAAGMFNEGYTFILQIMQDLELSIGQQCKYFADMYDIHRVQRQECRSLDSTKEARTARKEEQATLLEQFEEREGLLYGPGIAD